MKTLANQDMCNCNVIHQDIVDLVTGKMPNDEVLADVADLFKVFGDSTRVRILSALQESEMCVCDIAVLLNMTKSSISHQLRTLRQAKLIKNRKVGKVVYYSLDDYHVGTIFTQALAHVGEGQG
jgi:ArsR family transcriptional regulator